MLGCLGTGCNGSRFEIYRLLYSTSGCRKRYIGCYTVLVAVSRDTSAVIQHCLKRYIGCYTALVAASRDTSAVIQH